MGTTQLKSHCLDYVSNVCKTTTWLSKQAWSHLLDVMKSKDTSVYGCVFSKSLSLLIPGHWFASSPRLPVTCSTSCFFFFCFPWLPSVHSVRWMCLFPSAMCFPDKGSESQAEAACSHRFKERGKKTCIRRNSLVLKYIYIYIL